METVVARRLIMGGTDRYAEGITKLPPRWDRWPPCGRNLCASVVGKQ